MRRDIAELIYTSFTGSCGEVAVHFRNLSKTGTIRVFRDVDGLPVHMIFVREDGLRVDFASGFDDQDGEEISLREAGRICREDLEGSRHSLTTEEKNLLAREAGLLE